MTIGRYRLTDPTRFVYALTSVGLATAGGYYVALSLILYHLLGVGEVATLAVFAVGCLLVSGGAVVDGSYAGPVADMHEEEAS